ncbi:hypothetical protein PtA15_7A208 [Puccinia triticina]|uniref:Uncharacterized protein n=1 Tax=Puccinia triticina TaxID=208348 RepID=A0ABY7CPS7_9BASI|nr:uncharacterized protein PtA15_7A208 [Puccinia triticina]WAQ86482.1 hypothetical protein PtA15_7A208 [Puccinia triticina]
MFFLLQPALPSTTDRTTRNPSASSPIDDRPHDEEPLGQLSHRQPTTRRALPSPTNPTTRNPSASSPIDDHTTRNPSASPSIYHQSPNKVRPVIGLSQSPSAAQNFISVSAGSKHTPTPLHNHAFT